MTTAWIDVINVTTPFAIYVKRRKLQDGITEKKNRSEAKTRDYMNRCKLFN